MFLASSNVSRARGFQYFEDKNKLWSLTDTAIRITDGSLTDVGSISYKFTSDTVQANTWAIDKDGKILILMTNSSGGNQFFVSVTPSDNKDGGESSKPITIIGDNLPFLRNPQLMKIMNSRVFVLDSQYNNLDYGKVYVYTISNDGGVQSVTYLKWDPLNNIQGINDFELIPMKTGNAGFFLATVGKYGLVFFSFDSNGTFTATDPKSYNLADNPNVSNDVAYTRFLQL